MTDKKIIKTLEDMASDCDYNFSAIVLRYIKKIERENEELKSEITRVRNLNKRFEISNFELQKLLDNKETTGGDKHNS